MEDRPTIPSMSAPTNWDDILHETERQEVGGPVLLWLNFKFRREPYRFRIVAAPIVFRQYWRLYQINHETAWSKCGFTLSKQYACLVIDRDDGQLKITQGGAGVFKNIRDYQKETDNKVYAEVAADWQVQVKKFRGQDGREKTEYIVVAIGDCNPLTAEEKESIANLQYDWRMLFVRSSPERIREVYAGLSEAEKINPEGKRKDGPVVDSVRTQEVGTGGLHPKRQ